MFNVGSFGLPGSAAGQSFKPEKVLGGCYMGDKDTYRTLSVGKLIAQLQSSGSMGKRAIVTEIREKKWRCSSNFVLFVVGPDPADPSRLLVRKLVQVNDSTWGYEEVTISKNSDPAHAEDVSKAVVHSRLSRMGNVDLFEVCSEQEKAIRQKHRPHTNLLAYSMYSRGSHFSIVENSLWKASGWTWMETFRDFRDRRDLSRYLYWRWTSN